MTERLFEDGPTVEDITTTPSPWHVPDHLRDAYLDAAGSITHDQITEADQRSRPENANTWLCQIRDAARDLAALPPLDRRAADTTRGVSGWPTGVSVRGYVLHTLLLIEAEATVTHIQHADRIAAEWREMHTCHPCGVVDQAVSKGWCPECMKARLGVFLEDIETATTERVRRGTTRGTLVRNYLTNNPEQADTLYQLVTKAAHRG